MLDQFNAALRGPWRTSGLDVQWRWDKATHALAFQCTNSRSDWLWNFFAVAVDHDGDLVHAGFAALWESVKHEIAGEVGNATDIRIVGYSQGAAITTLAHRYFQRTEKRPTTVVFGSPMVFASVAYMDNFTNVQNRGDIVCHVRSSKKFRHVGEVKLIGPNHWPNLWDHAPSAYRKYLK